MQLPLTFPEPFLMTDPLPGASGRDYDCILKQSVRRAAEAATVLKPCVLVPRCACISHKRLLQRKQLEGGLALEGRKGNSAAEMQEETYVFLNVKTSHPHAPYTTVLVAR